MEAKFWTANTKNGNGKAIETALFKRVSAIDEVACVKIHTYADSFQFTILSLLIVQTTLCRWWLKKLQVDQHF